MKTLCTIRRNAIRAIPNTTSRVMISIETNAKAARTFLIPILIGVSIF
jgi:hypothetical protein